MSDELRDRIIGWVNEHLRSGDTLRVAVEKAKAVLIGDATSLMQFADDYFPQIAFGFWNEREGAEGSVLNGKFQKRDREAQLPGRVVVQTGPRVVDPAVLQQRRSLFDCLIDIGGGWKPFGLLTREDIAAATATYERCAASQHRIALFLKEVSDLIEGGKELRDCASEADVEVIQERYQGLQLEERAS